MNLKGQLVIHIHLIYEKLPISGWKDIRRNVHVHSLYWIHSGKGSFYADQEYAVSAGMLVYLKPGLEMKMKSEQEHPLRITMVLMDCADVLYENDSWHHRSVNDLNIDFLRQCSTVEKKKMDAMFRTFFKNSSSKNSLNEVKSRNSLSELIYQLMLDKGRQSAVVMGTAYQAYLEIKHYLEQHYEQDIKIKELAERFSISESFLRKTFQRYTQESPKQYLNRIRDEQATRLLLYTEEPMKEIAHACGYVDEYHFSKMFKQRHMLPPTIYREQKRK